MSNLKLRDYQVSAMAAILIAHYKGQHPVVSLPTGAGKSIVVAGLVAELIEADIVPNGRIVITVPSRELALQNEGALLLALPADHVGVVCASLGRREFDRRVIVGTPQSLAGKLPFDPYVIIVDEAHQMPLHKGSWFAKLFKALPRGRKTPRIGLSATTFRTADGAIYGVDDKAWFSCQPFEMKVSELVARGHLAPVRYAEPSVLMTVKGVAKSAGDYNQAQLVEANLDQVAPQVRTFLDELFHRRKGLIFAVNVEHAKAFVAELRAQGVNAVLIIGEMSAKDRQKSVASYKAGRERVCVTVQAALTGFDVPDIDLIASCRPTMSPIIHTQSIGRGTRPSPGKSECLVIDFAANIPLFGPVHAPHFDKSGQPLGGVAPWRACSGCGTYNHYEATACGHCDRELMPCRVVTAADLEYGEIQWAPENTAIDAIVARAGTSRLPVESIAVHAYRKKSDPTSVSCMLSIGLGGDAIVRMWFKKLKSPRWAEAWCMLLGNAPIPRTLEEAQARRSELIRPASITMERNGSFWCLLSAEYGELEPEAAA